MIGEHVARLRRRRITTNTHTHTRKQTHTRANTHTEVRVEMRQQARHIGVGRVGVRDAGVEQLLRQRAERHV